ncbi:hypothetical protein H0H92_004283 [Tricholoma furcatifolium]|nr:hypothetical protein H0H92_004283 [Tricholoma furcatifolium]
MLLRSKSTPLTLTYRSHMHRDEEIYLMLKELLRKQLSRIQSLSLSVGASGQRWSTLLPFLHHAPLLEYLELDLAHRDQTTLILSSPLIKHLSLRRCGLACDTPASVLCNLRFLDISHPPKSAKLSITQLWVILSQTSLLKTLDIIEGLVDLEHPDQGLALRQTLTPIQLDVLEKMSLSCDPFSSALIFDFLTFPRNIRFIQSSQPTIQASQLEPSLTCMKYLGQKLGNAVDGMIFGLMLGTEVSCWISSNPKTAVSMRSAATLRINSHIIQAQIRTPHQIQMSLNEAFCQSLPLHRLSSLAITDEVTFATWSLFSDLPYVEHVRVSSFSKDPLLQVLSRGMIVEPGTDTGARPSFTSLRTLTLVGWHLDQDMRLFSQRTTMTAAQGVGMCLKLRHKAGLHLELLHLKTYEEVSTDNRRLLEKYVYQLRVTDGA